MEGSTIRRDGTQSNRENALARKAEAELKKLEAESEIQAAEDEVKRYDEQLEEIMSTRADLKAGRQAVRETHQVSERVLQMLNHVVRQLRNVGSLNEGVKKHLFQDEEKKGNVQLQMLRMMMESAKRKSGTETPRSMPSVVVTDDEGDGRRKRVKGTDKPAEPAGEPPKEKMRPAPKVAPDIIKEHQSKEAKKEKQQDRKRELENVNQKWLMKQERKDKESSSHSGRNCFHCGSDSHRAFECEEMLRQAREAGAEMLSQESKRKGGCLLFCICCYRAKAGFTITEDGRKRIAIGWGSHTVQRCRYNKDGYNPAEPDMSVVNQPKKQKVEEKVIDVEAEDKQKPKGQGTASASTSTGEKPNIFTTEDGKIPTAEDGRIRPNPRWGEEKPRDDRAKEERTRPEEKKMLKKSKDKDSKDSKGKVKKERKEPKDKKRKKEKKDQDRKPESPEKTFSEKDVADMG